jgi:flagellin-like hook-associated protein FlgL
LSNANINITSAACAFDTGTANVVMVLQGTNTLKSGSDYAGLRVASGASLTLYGATDDAKLTTSGGTITINGGTITAKGGTSVFGGAGIGAGHFGNGYTVTINGGTVNAYGGGHGSGIGGAHGNAVGKVYINGGGGDIYGGSGKNAAIGGGEGNAKVDVFLTGSYHKGDSQFVTGTGTFNLHPTGGAPYINAEHVTLEPPEYTRDVYDLAHIAEFYDANGTFLLADTQTIQIYQGDGKKTSVNIYASDTMYDVAKRINDAIAYGLGQIAYIDGMPKFCTIADGTPGTESVVGKDEAIWFQATDDEGNKIGAPYIVGYSAYYSTMLVRSAVTGAAGELVFTGDDELLRALGLNTIQQATESTYSTKVFNAHTGEIIGTQTISGNVIYAAIGENVDVRFDTMAGTRVTWNDATKNFMFSSSGVYTTTVHIADKSAALQIGANERETLWVLFGDMGATALGLDGLLVVDREHSAKAITTLDRAISRVSTQRAALGAQQNALEHTVSNVTNSATNLTAAESRIRDADMAMEMMNLTRMQILMQSGTAMLAQANQLPQSVLSLLS